MEFIDLTGASGVTYRFRAWPETDQHPPMAGNYAVVRTAGGRPEVVTIGVINDLSLARRSAQLEPGSQLFTRLNVSRASREAEHEDLAAAHPAAAEVRLGS